MSLRPPPPLTTFALTAAILTVLPSCSITRALRATWARAAAPPKALEMPTQKAGENETSPAMKLYEWNGEGIAGRPAIRISLAEQKARFYRGDQIVGWTYVATGVPSHPTPRGTFHISEKTVNKRSNLYGVVVDSDGDVVDGDAKAGRERVPKGGRFVGAPMPHFMRLTAGGVGMHEGPIPVPGQPASHGCIRMPGEMATRFFENAPSGTPVTIYGEL